MPYTLWSRGRLLGHTDLDIPCVQSFIRQGFVEPTDEGRRVLPDATAVAALSCHLSRSSAVNGRRDEREVDLSEFQKACARREALELQLRDESGAVFPAEWIQVNDLRALDARQHDEIDAEPLDPELEAAIQHDADLFESEHEDRPWGESDVRWETMQYHMMVYLAGSMDIAD